MKPQNLIFRAWARALTLSFVALVFIASVALVSPPPRARAQENASQQPKADEPKAVPKAVLKADQNQQAPEIKLAEPVPFRVYQRDREGKAEIAVSLGDTKGFENPKVVSASIFGEGGLISSRFEDGKLFFEFLALLELGRCRLGTFHG